MRVGVYEARYQNVARPLDGDAGLVVASCQFERQQVDNSPVTDNDRVVSKDGGGRFGRNAPAGCNQRVTMLHLGALTGAWGSRFAAFCESAVYRPEAAVPVAPKPRIYWPESVLLAVVMCYNSDPGPVLFEDRIELAKSRNISIETQSFLPLLIPLNERSCAEIVSIYG